MSIHIYLVAYWNAVCILSPMTSKAINVLSDVIDRKLQFPFNAINSLTFLVSSKFTESRAINIFINSFQTEP